MSTAILRHAFSKGLKIVGMALRAEGSAIGRQALRRVSSEFGKVEGIDYVFLGYRPELTASILGLGTSFQRVFPHNCPLPSETRRPRFLDTPRVAF